MNVDLKNIYNSVKEMGYIIATPRRSLEPSFYKLSKNDIIVSALIKANYCTSHPTEFNNASINTSTNVHIFVPIKNRKKNYMSQNIDPKINIVEEDIEYDILKENFNVYDLSNDVIMSVKTVVAQINRTDSYSNEGEPVYSINVQPIVKFKKKVV